MKNILTLLQEKIRNALGKVLSQELEDMPELLQADVAQITNPQFGHYQCNNALKIAKQLKKSPRDTAEMIISHLREDDGGKPFLSRVEIAGPGFINFTIDANFLAEQVGQMINDPHAGACLPKERKKIIVEFSSPNVAKELHVGHLRSTIIGDCLARLFEFFGQDVLRLNHIGDWGTQFGMLIAYLKEKEPGVPSGEVPTNLPALMHWYRESKKLFDADSDFKKRAQLQVVKLQRGDEESLKAWEIICEISRRAYQEIYDLLDIKITERGESFYNPYLPEVVQDLEKKGLVTLSDGAKCVFLEGFESREGTPLPMIIQKSDGGYNYDTTDMAAIKHRIEKEKADRIIVVTDAGQSLHFQMIFKAAEKAGYLNPVQVQVDHVTFGVVLGVDGKKFKTRSGETEKLIDLLFEAVRQAEGLLREKLEGFNTQEIKTMSEILGIDAVKYADLACHRQKDYVFSYERMLRFEGNTAAFLLYAYVRIQGIKRKVNKDIAPLLIRPKIVLQHHSEIALALHLRQFGETLDVLARELLPNRLCDYLYELAEKFHAFFRDCRVEGDPLEDSRLLLCEAAANVLQKGLHILGLRTLERM